MTMASRTMQLARSVYPPTCRCGKVCEVMVTPDPTTMEYLFTARCPETLVAGDPEGKHRLEHTRRTEADIARWTSIPQYVFKSTPASGTAGLKAKSVPWSQVEVGHVLQFVTLEFTKELWVVLSMVDLGADRKRVRLRRLGDDRYKTIEQSIKDSVGVVVNRFDTGGNPDEWLKRYEDTKPPAAPRHEEIKLPAKELAPRIPAAMFADIKDLVRKLNEGKISQQQFRDGVAQLAVMYNADLQDPA